MLHDDEPSPPERLVAPTPTHANIIRCNPETLPDIIHITDPDDPRIVAYARVRERDLVGRLGGFIAEGEVVLNVLLGSGSRCKASSLLLAEKRLERLRPLIDGLPPEVPVYVAGPAVMDTIVGFHIHRGIMAHGVRPADPGAEALLGGLGPRALVLVLFSISNHDNMGGLFRNAAAFGADAVLLDPACCDPLYRKAIRVSVGAALKVPFARLPAAEDPLALMARARFTPLALSPGGAEPLAGLSRPDRAAVLLGAEGQGLPSELLQRARTLAVPMAAGWDSLNVASTSAIVLHELTRADRSGHAEPA